MGLSVLLGHKKKIAALLLVLVVMASVVIFFRGPYVSNMLKMAILPRVNEATGLNVIAGKIILNIFPLYAEARDVKAFGRDKQRVFTAGRVKAYLSISDILKRRVVVSRVVIVRPVVSADLTVALGMAGAVGKKKKEGMKIVSLDVKTVAVKQGDIYLKDEKTGVNAQARGLDADIVFKENPEVLFSIKKVALEREGWPSIEAGLSGSAVVLQDAVEFNKFRLDSRGSVISGSGRVSRDMTAAFSLDARLLMETFKETLGLENTGEGTIYASGNVALAEDVRRPHIDVELHGDFHLETLLEMVRVKPEYGLSGLVSFNGKLGGDISELKGSADARIVNGGFFGVKIDEGITKVVYEGGRLDFRQATAKTYGGDAEVEVSIGLPRVQPYSVDVVFERADIGPVLELIKLGRLRLPRGKAEGELHSSGERFNPEGWVVYRADEKGDDVLGRVRAVNGSYSMADKIVSLSGFKVRTGVSSLAFNGTVDLKDRGLEFDGRMNSADINDIFEPYIKGLNGTAEFVGKVTGSIEDPAINGKISLWQAAYKGYAVGEARGDVFYRKDILAFKHADAEKGQRRHSAGGTVRFGEASWLFDFKKPLYDMEISAENGDLAELLGMLGFDVPVEGTFSTILSITGEGPVPVFSGDASVTEANFYGRPIESAAFIYRYSGGEFSVSDVLIRKSGSSLALGGRVSALGSFDFEVFSDNMKLSNFFAKPLPFDYTVGLRAQGRGTFKDPDIQAEFVLSNGKFKDADIGGGRVEASLEGRELHVEAKAVNQGISFSSRVVLEGETPWSARLDIAQGRYDFLIAAFLKRIPDDLMLSMSGSIDLRGDRENLSGKAFLRRLNLNMFGQGFTNKSDIVVAIDENRVTLSDVEIRSGNTFLRMAGYIDLNSYYDLVAEGKASLSVLGGLLDRVDTIGGNTEFVFSLRGPWKSPSLNGGLSVSEGVISLKSQPYRLSSVKGYMYVEDDRLVIRKMEGALGGGNVEIDGVMQLKGLGLERLYVDAVVDDVTLSPSRGFRLNIGGKLLFVGSSTSRDITGELQVNRAVYRERMERRSIKVPRTEKAWADSVGLNIRLFGTDNIRIDNNIAMAPLSVDLVVGGTLGFPRLYGRIESSEGKVFFRNTEFRIISATADYVDAESSQPVISIQAETSVKGYHVWLNLDGRVEQFDLVLSSDPPLDEFSILALLTYGEYDEGGRGFESGIGTAFAADVITGNRDLIEEKVKDLTGLDRLQIDPYFSEGKVTPFRVTVSKRLLRERLFITYSSTIGDNVNDELKLEYLLFDNVSVLGGKDNTGGIGGDLKFRFRFK